jgi:hypothetical protein
MISGLTEAGTFWFYAVVCALGTLFVLKFCPETKGRTLEEIQDFFNGKQTAGAGSGLGLVKGVGLILLLVMGAAIALSAL